MASVKKTASQQPSEPELPFEAAMERLEGIVDSLESETLSLEKMIQIYEEGMKLNQQCQNRLKQAELTIKKLEKQRLADLNLDTASDSENSADDAF